MKDLLRVWRIMILFIASVYRCLGALEVLDLVLQGDKVAKKFEDAKEVCIDLLRLGFQDGLGPKIRFRATTVVNRIRDVVHEDVLQVVFFHFTYFVSYSYVVKLIILE